MRSLSTGSVPPSSDIQSNSFALKRAVTIGFYERSQPKKVSIPLSSKDSDDATKLIQTTDEPFLTTPTRPTISGRSLSLIDSDSDNETESNDFAPPSSNGVPLVPPPVAFGQGSSPPIPQIPTSGCARPSTAMSSTVSQSCSDSIVRSDNERNCVMRSVHSDASNDGHTGTTLERRNNLESINGIRQKPGDGNDTSATNLGTRIGREGDSSTSLISTSPPELHSSRTGSFAAKMFQKISKKVSRGQHKQASGCLLNLDAENCRSLAMVVEKKTKGNPNSVMKFVGFLERDGLLVFSMKNHRWEWDGDQIDTVAMATSDVGELLTAQVGFLPPDSLSVLKLAACIGISFEENILEKLIEENFFGDDRDAEYSVSGSQEERVDKSMLCSIHLQIGKAIISCHESQQEDLPKNSAKALVESANHFYLGRGAVQSESDRIEFCKVHLQASASAKDQGSFRAAGIFLERAIISFFSHEDWSNHYHLELEAYSSAAEIFFSCGDLDKSMKFSEHVIQNANRVEERLRGYFVKIDVLAAERRFAAAIDESLNLLDLLGCHIPTQWRRYHAMRDLSKIRKELAGRTFSDLSAMKPMQPTLQVSALRVMDTLTFLLTLQGNVEMGNIILTKMVLATLNSGMSVYAPCSLAGNGMLLVHSGDFNNGYRYGELSLRLAENVHSKRALVRTAFVVYTFLSWIRKPLTEGIEVMLNAHRMGMPVGLPLGPFSDDMKQFLEQLELYNQNQCTAMILCFYQMSLNLTGESNSHLSGFCENDDGDAMKLDSVCSQFFTQDDLANDHGVILVNLKLLTLMLSYVFQDIESLRIWFQTKKSWKGLMSRSHFMCMYMTLFAGLAALSIYRRTRKRRFYRKAIVFVSSLESLAKNAGINVVPLQQLLHAERSTFFFTDARTIQRNFDETIASLTRCGLIHLEAIACERAGDFMTVQGNTYWAKTYYCRSMERYEEWGALATIRQLSATKIADMPERATPQKDSVIVSVRGKRRYDPEAWSTIEKVDLVEHGSDIRKRVG
ncbi:multi-sensor signal transduction multi-kinase [Nitzschia inconspicua]|uniref:Multi-sensor signal transduction multi-kinase n=1 Tax=Nitzschia inconspicua TaxID=303405 RepID=A0A9K3LT28_9STRA|nr:multi-sensor signal transduction multi-kinase [Nitzschia inconspicua]